MQTKREQVMLPARSRLQTIVHISTVLPQVHARGEACTQQRPAGTPVKCGEDVQRHAVVAAGLDDPKP